MLFGLRENFLTVLSKKAYISLRRITITKCFNGGFRMGIIDNYFKERKRVTEINSVYDIGYLLTCNTDKLGTKKVFKPSEYEIDEHIAKCKRYKDNLVEYIADVSCREHVVFPEELVKDINELKVDKLNNCKQLGSLYMAVGVVVKKQVKFNRLLTPVLSFGNNINVIELFILCLFIFLVLGILSVIY